ncbi:MAG: condensation domain-containing protein [Clostridia bacterium]
MPKTLKAEMWDKMQFLFRNYYDRMVHAVLHYDGLIDINILKNVVISMAEKVPILHSSFHHNPVNPYWKVEDYTIGDIVTVKETSDLDKDVDVFICQSIEVESNVQFKIAVFNFDNKSTLCMIVNHMCFDGGDFKYFLKKLCANYNAMLKGEKALDIKTGSRSHEQVYTKLDEKETKIAKGLYKNISQVQDKHYFPLTESRDDDHTMIIKRKISAEKFELFRKTGKALDVTVNDLMLAVYVRALYEISNIPINESLTIPCMVDLRRHIEGGEEAGGLANHTGFMQCSVSKKGDTINDTLIEVLRSVSKNKRDKYLGLYSLPLLKLAYSVFPFAISEFAIKIGYANPLIGMSNIGILPVDKLALGALNIVDGFMTGAVKFKPFMQLALTTCYGAATMTIAIRGNDDDREIVERFFDLVTKNIDDFIELNKTRL